MAELRKISTMVYYDYQLSIVRHKFGGDVYGAAMGNLSRFQW